MIINIVYAFIAALVIFALDWVVYGRMSNVISLARLSKGEDDPDQPYNPLKKWRIICSIMGSVLFLGSEFAHSPAQDILYVGVAIAAVVMVLFTYVEVTSR